MRKLTHQELSAKRVPVQQVENAVRLPIYALMDSIRSMYNIGSIFRTCDGVMLSKLFLSGYTPYPPRMEIEKTSLGAVNTVPWEYYENPVEAVQSLKKEGVTICALEHTDKSIPYNQVSKERFPICLVAGNELTGISSSVLSEADLAIEIPMFGTKQSLNVAVAVGIALFELARVWKER